MITVTEQAREQLDLLRKEQNAKEDSFIRVGVSSGGCSGLSYILDFDTESKEGDQVIEDKGVRLLIDKKSVLYLAGTELDYTGGLNGKGFTFNNPNASRTCGCGESFSI